METEILTLWNREKSGSILNKEEKQLLKKEIARIERQITASFKVIVTTCITAGTKKVKNRRNFPLLIINEYGQAIECEALVPIMNSRDRVILVGDDKQLRSVVTSRIAANAGLDRSLMERLHDSGIKPFKLYTQRRMRPELIKFCSDQFYGSELKTDVDYTKLIKLKNFPWTKEPILFENVEGTEELSSSGTSYINRAEAERVLNWLSKLFDHGVKSNDVAILVPYRGQFQYIKDLLSHKIGIEKFSETNVVSFDSMQGSESQFVIISLVRANSKTMGFNKDERRINVALSRAKSGLILLGHKKTMLTDRLWTAWIEHLRNYWMFQVTRIQSDKLIVYPLLFLTIALVGHFPPIHSVIFFLFSFSFFVF